MIEVDSKQKIQNAISKKKRKYKLDYNDIRTLEEKAEEFYDQALKVHEAFQANRVFVKPHAVDRIKERFDLEKFTGYQLLYLILYSPKVFKLTAYKRTRNAVRFRFGLANEEFNLFFIVNKVKKRSLQERYDFEISTTVWKKNEDDPKWALHKYYDEEIWPVFCKELLLPKFKLKGGKLVFYLKDSEGKVRGLKSEKHSSKIEKLIQDIKSNGLYTIHKGITNTVYNNMFRDIELEVHEDCRGWNIIKWFHSSGLRDLLKEYEDDPEKFAKDRKIAPPPSKWIRINKDEISYPWASTLRTFYTQVLRKNNIAFKVWDRTKNVPWIEAARSNSDLFGEYYRDDKILRIDIISKDRTEIIRSYELNGYTLLEDIIEFGWAWIFEDIGGMDASLHSRDYSGLTQQDTYRTPDGPCCFLPKSRWCSGGEDLSESSGVCSDLPEDNQERPSVVSGVHESDEAGVQVHRQGEQQPLPSISEGAES